MFQTPKELKKHQDCYKKVAPSSVPFPSDWKDAKQVKKFSCQGNWEKISEDMEKCEGKLTKKQIEEEEKKTEKCMKKLAKAGKKSS